MLLPLPDQDGAKLTIAKYYTPKGENIHGKGIKPDILVEEEDDYLFYDGFVTNVDDKAQEASKEKILTSIVGEKEAKKLIKKEDKQLKTAEAAIISMIKERKNKK